LPTEFPTFGRVLTEKALLLQRHSVERLDTGLSHAGGWRCFVVKRKEAKEKTKIPKVVQRGGTYCVRVTAFCNSNKNDGL